MNNQEVLEFFTKLIKNLDSENRDNLINSILNELRFPSNQTYYFSCLFICIFCEIKNEQIEEHILRYIIYYLFFIFLFNFSFCRNIIQRLLYKPCPWGIIVTFIELYRFPKYELFKKPFIKNFEKTIEDLMKFIKSSKLNKNLRNFSC
jgi:CCR4-NOT transcription complex subunit 1